MSLQSSSHNCMTVYLILSWLTFQNIFKLNFFTLFPTKYSLYSSLLICMIYYILHLHLPLFQNPVSTSAMTTEYVSRTCWRCWTRARQQRVANAFWPSKQSHWCRTSRSWSMGRCWAPMRNECWTSIMRSYGNKSETNWSDWATWRPSTGWWTRRDTYVNICPRTSIVQQWEAVITPTTIYHCSQWVCWPWR